MDGNVIVLQTEDLWERRQTVVTEIAPGPQRSWLTSLIAWGFEELYGKEQPCDPVVTPAAMLHVLATIGLMLSVISGAWVGALICAAVIVAMPVLCIVGAMAVFIAVGGLDDCECGCGMH